MSLKPDLPCALSALLERILNEFVGPPQKQHRVKLDLQAFSKEVPLSITHVCSASSWGRKKIGTTEVQVVVTFQRTGMVRSLKKETKGHNHEELWQMVERKYIKAV